MNRSSNGRLRRCSRISGWIIAAALMALILNSGIESNLLLVALLAISGLAGLVLGQFIPFLLIVLTAVVLWLAAVVLRLIAGPE